MEPKLFSEITLLITHYNRSSSLVRLLKSFKDLNVRFKEIIISDDGSQTEHLNRLDLLKDTFDFRLICSDRNRGLANNINKGQRAISSPFTLYIQEDFTPNDEFKQFLANGLSLIKEDPTIDLIRFYAYKKPPYLKIVKNGFFEIEFHFWRPNFWQFHCYSDHPHLRRSSFLEKFGIYREGIPSDKAEFRMAISFLQKKGKALIHENYKEIFTQENSPQEPSMIPRRKLRKYFQLSNHFIIKIVRFIYRNIKFRTAYLFYK